MNNEKVAKIIKSRCKLIGISLKTLLEECGANRNFMYDLRKGQHPSVETLEAFAKHLDCSVDYLLGRTDSIAPVLAPDEQELLTNYRSLDTTGKKKIDEYIYDLCLLQERGLEIKQISENQSAILRNNAEVTPEDKKEIEEIIKNKQ